VAVGAQETEIARVVVVKVSVYVVNVETQVCALPTAIVQALLAPVQPSDGAQRPAQVVWLSPHGPMGNPLQDVLRRQPVASAARRTTEVRGVDPEYADPSGYVGLRASSLCQAQIAQHTSYRLGCHDGRLEYILRVFGRPGHGGTIGRAADTQVMARLTCSAP
jgi:hypothetical protein